MVWYLDTVHRGPFVAWAYLLPSSSVVAVDWAVVVAYPQASASYPHPAVEVGLLVAAAAKVPLLTEQSADLEPRH